MNTNSMTPTNTDITCNHPANDLIEAVAFGFASTFEIALVQEHVSTCATCSLALEEARFAAQAVPLTVDDMDVPESVWTGIEQRIAAADSSAETVLASPAPQPARAPFRLHWAMAAMLAVLTLAGGILLGRTVLESGPDTTPAPVAEVSITDPEIGATGSVHYFADQGVILLDLENLPPTQEGFVYQVWMIEGDTPISMGLFDPGSNRFATAGNPNDFDLLAITVEQGPFGSDQPTTDPLVVADLEPLQGN